MDFRLDVSGATKGATHTRRSAAGELVGVFRLGKRLHAIPSNFARRSPITHKAARASRLCGSQTRQGGWHPESSAPVWSHTHGH